MIKKIFTDMDGTLLTSNGSVSASTQQFMHNLEIPVTLVSARAPMEMLPTIESLGLTSPQIAFNGCLIFRPTNMGISSLFEATLDTEEVKRLSVLLTHYFPQVSASLYDHQTWYTVKNCEEVEFQKRITGVLPVITELDKICDRPGNPFFKLMLITFDEKTMVNLTYFLTELGLKHLAIHRAGHYHLEVTSGVATKSTAITYLLEEENLSPEVVAAFGDGYNDIPMLELVGLPIVMGNAPADVKCLTTLITTSNDDDAVKEGIERFILG